MSTTDITAATNALTVVVGSTSLAFADAMHPNRPHQDLVQPALLLDCRHRRQHQVVTGPTPMVPPDWSLKPTGLAEGSQFRLLFLSSTRRDATATDIADYNTFVQDRAEAGHTDIQGYSAGFRAVGCTADTDARDNTATTGTGVPIYWLDGTKAADDYADFYDGDWDDEANDKNESGTDAPIPPTTTPPPATTNHRVFHRLPLAVCAVERHCDHRVCVHRHVVPAILRRRLLGESFVRVGSPNSSNPNHSPLNGDRSATASATPAPCTGSRRSSRC